jgi:hypothetical protein
MKRWTIVSVLAALILTPLVGFAAAAAPPAAADPKCPTAAADLFATPTPQFLVTPQFCESRRCGTDDDCLSICGCEGGSCVYRPDCGFLTCLCPICSGNWNSSSPFGAPKAPAGSPAEATPQPAGA